MAEYKAVIQIAVLLAVPSFTLGCREAPTPPLQAERLVAAIPSDQAADDEAIRFLEQKARDDDQDFIARNKLVGYYMKKLRETGSVKYLELASRAADESLAASPARFNPGGLGAKAQVEFASHDFAAARDHAIELRDTDPDKTAPYLLLGDAQLELGEYDAASETFGTLERRSAADGVRSLNLATRLARLALLRGDARSASRLYEEALAAARAADPVSRESVAWCHWQLGETAFAVGDYAAAERHYADALVVFPDYYRGLASTARVRAAQGDIPAAIAGYERVTRILPDPGYIAALGDLYRIDGREREASAQYELVRQIGTLSKLNGTLYNRQLALFWADHDLNAPDAYENAKREYEVRKDVYGADALAWTALKAGKIDEARTAIRDALRIGTKDARLLYHAGMIANAAGETESARSYLQQALALSPAFDPIQSKNARATLEEITQRR